MPLSATLLLCPLIGGLVLAPLRAPPADAREPTLLIELVTPAEVTPRLPEAPQEPPEPQPEPAPPPPKKGDQTIEPLYLACHDRTFCRKATRGGVATAALGGATLISGAVLLLRHERASGMLTLSAGLSVTLIGAILLASARGPRRAARLSRRLDGGALRF